MADESEPQLISSGHTQNAWHSLAIHEVVKACQTDLAVGLTIDEVDRRRALYGSNILPEPIPVSYFHRIRNQLNQPLILVLLGAGALTGLMGEWLDCSVIIGAHSVSDI